MARDPFLNPAMSVALDLLRALAAMVVVVAHTAMLRVYSGPLPFYRMFAHDAVLLFFVLSGLVIHGSAGRPGMTLRGYAVARAARILPVSVAALALAILVHLLATAFAGGDLNPARNADLTPDSLLLSITFLSEHHVGLPGPVANPPYWSLCYEVWFYALFGAWFFLKGRVRLLAMAVCAALAGINILLLLPVWAMGVAVSAGGAPAMARPRAACMLAGGVGGFVMCNLANLPEIGAGLLVTAGIDPLRLGLSVTVVSDLFEGACIAASLVALRALLADGSAVPARLAGPVRWFASFSFSLYLFHWPVLLAMRACGILGFRHPAALPLLLAVPIGIAWAVSLVLERRVPALLRAWATPPLRLGAALPA